MCHFFSSSVQKGDRARKKGRTSICFAAQDAGDYLCIRIAIL